MCKPIYRITRISLLNKMNEISYFVFIIAFIRFQICKGSIITKETTTFWWNSTTLIKVLFFFSRPIQLFQCFSNISISFFKNDLHFGDHLFIRLRFFPGMRSTNRLKSLEYFRQHFHRLWHGALSSWKSTWFFFIWSCFFVISSFKYTSWISSDYLEFFKAIHWQNSMRILKYGRQFTVLAIVHKFTAPQLITDLTLEHSGESKFRLLLHTDAKVRSIFRSSSKYLQNHRHSIDFRSLCKNSFFMKKCLYKMKQIHSIESLRCLLSPASKKNRNRFFFKLYPLYIYLDQNSLVQSLYPHWKLWQSMLYVCCLENKSKNIILVPYIQIFTGSILHWHNGKTGFKIF